MSYSGIILSSLLIMSAISVAILSFTTSCRTDIPDYERELGSRIISVFLFLLSVISAVFERWMNLRHVEMSFLLEEKTDEIKTLKARSEPAHEQENEEVIESRADTGKSDGNETIYPPVIRFN